jgi:hypothetical protein
MQALERPLSVLPTRKPFSIHRSIGLIELNASYEVTYANQTARAMADVGQDQPFPFADLISIGRAGLQSLAGPAGESGEYEAEFTMANAYRSH